MKVNSSAANPHIVSSPASRAQAHGAVRKLGSGHFNPAVEARLTERFGHRLSSPQPDPIVQPDIQDVVDVKPLLEQEPAPAVPLSDAAADVARTAQPLQDTIRIDLIA